MRRRSQCRISSKSSFLVIRSGYEFGMRPFANQDARLLCSHVLHCTPKFTGTVFVLCFFPQSASTPYRKHLPARDHILPPKMKNTKHRRPNKHRHILMCQDFYCNSTARLVTVLFLGEHDSRGAASYLQPFEGCCKRQIFNYLIVL